MKEFKKVDKIFTNSHNSTNKIFNRYTITLSLYVFYIMIYNAIWSDKLIVISLLKSLLVTISISIILCYLVNIIKKEYQFKRIFVTDHIITPAIILSLFLTNENLLVIIIATFIMMVFKTIFKNTNTTSSLYGIVFILIYHYLLKDITPLTNLGNLNYIGSYKDIVTPYGSILSYTLGLKYYLSPLLSIIIFIYLLLKKSIKYNLFISYITTFIIIMLTYGLLNNMNVWYLFFQITTGNILFLSIYCLTDYQITPTTNNGQIIYGILLGTITSILRFIIPELSVVITLIIGPIFLTKYIDKISFKLQYNKKFNTLIFSITIIIALTATIFLNILK